MLQKLSERIRKYITSLDYMTKWHSSTEHGYKKFRHFHKSDICIFLIENAIFYNLTAF